MSTCRYTYIVHTYYNKKEKIWEVVFCRGDFNHTCAHAHVCMKNTNFTLLYVCTYIYMYDVHSCMSLSYMF